MNTKTKGIYIQATPIATNAVMDSIMKASHWCDCTISRIIGMYEDDHDYTIPDEIIDDFSEKIEALIGPIIAGGLCDVNRIYGRIVSKLEAWVDANDPRAMFHQYMKILELGGYELDSSECGRSCRICPSRTTCPFC